MNWLDVLSNGSVAIGASATTGIIAVLIARHTSRTQRRERLDDDRLAILVKMYSLVEIGEGRWRGWAESIHIKRPDVSEKLSLAEQAIHDAWYATREFEILFPTLSLEMDKTRRQLEETRELAEQQANRGVFIGKEFDDRHVQKNLREIVVKAREIIELPN